MDGNEGHTSFSASANSFRMFSSEAPTYLFKISGPFTIFGSLAFNIFPICLAMRVFPVPGGPCNRIPNKQGVVDAKYCRSKITHTFDMLDAKFLDETRRKHTRGESSTKDLIELRVKTPDSHVLKFEIRGQNGIGSCPVTCR